MIVLEVENLTKYYRQHFWTPRRRVLNDVSFRVEAGEIFGFLGPNGAGKSTAIKIILQIIYASSGKVRLFGRSIENPRLRREIGFLPENSYFYDYLTATQFLEFHGRLAKMSDKKIQMRIPEVLEKVGMIGTENMKLRSFSKGMLQRIGLAQSILHDPQLVILDEPMTGLDPLGRKEVRDLMIHLRDEGKTVFFSTHILSDVESICDRVAILNKGDLLKCGRLDELVSIDTQSAEVIWLNKFDSLSQWADRHHAQLVSDGDAFFYRLFPKDNESSSEFQKRASEVVKAGIQEGGVLKTLSHRQDSLEDVFVKQVGNLTSRV